MDFNPIFVYRLTLFIEVSMVISGVVTIASFFYSIVACADLPEHKKIALPLLAVSVVLLTLTAMVNIFIPCFVDIPTEKEVEVNQYLSLLVKTDHNVWEAKCSHCKELLQFSHVD